MIVGRIKLARIIAQIGFAKSVSDAKRLIEQGAVRIDGARVTYPELEIVIVRAP